MLRSNQLLTGYKNRGDASGSKPSDCGRPARTVGQVDIDQRAIHFGRGCGVLQFGETFQRPGENMTKVFDHLFQVEYDQGIVFQAKNPERACWWNGVTMHGQQTLIVVKGFKRCGICGQRPRNAAPWD